MQKRGKNNKVKPIDQYKNNNGQSLCDEGSEHQGINIINDNVVII